MLQSDRLILRQWTEEDFSPFAKICADKDVMHFFPKTLTEQESHDMARKVQSLIDSRGWGFWAVEIPNEAKFIGCVGLNVPKESMPFAKNVEIGWRLAKDFWGNGYATEAAKEVLRYAFVELNLNEVISFAPLGNKASQHIMMKIGMSDTGNNFNHPELDASHPQSEHVLYKINKSQWLEHA